MIYVQKHTGKIREREAFCSEADFVFQNWTLFLIVFDAKKHKIIFILKFASPMLLKYSMQYQFKRPNLIL
jgi:hypothetical protein